MILRQLTKGETMSEHEAATKAAQSADLLLQDLQEMNRNGNLLLHLLIIDDICAVARLN